MEGYKVTIRSSSRELTGKEKLKLMDFSNAEQLTDLTADSPIVIKPALYAVCDVHNDKSDHKDYVKYVIIDSSGNKYVTGSESFWSSYMNIVNAMEGEPDDWEIECYQDESKNYAGRKFLTCSIV